MLFGGPNTPVPGPLMVPHKVASAFRRALVVEDDPVLRRSLARSLRGWGLETLEASNVKMASKMLRREPDLVVTDVRLPDGTGQEVVRRAARLRSRPFIVAVSGEASRAEAFELARAPVRLYLEKPFTMAELADRICAAVASNQVDERTLPWRESVPEHLRNALLEELRQIAVEYALTPRETECVRLTLAGSSRAELPQALGVSANTCKTLIRGVLRKFGSTRLTQVTTLILTRARWEDDRR